MTDFKLHVLKTGHIVLEVFTDGGITGLGECSSMAGESPAAVVVERTLRRHVVGKSPFDAESIWRDAFLGRKSSDPIDSWLNAVAGADIALWDIMGKALNVPCYALMGGKVRDKVPLRASAMCGCERPGEGARRLLSWVERGFRAVKVCCCRSRGSREADDTLDIAREVRAALGKDVSLSVDANHAYSVYRAIQVGRELEKLDCALFEAPLAAGDLEVWARLSIALDIPVGAGRREHTRWEHKDLLLEGRVDVLQPDLLGCGGLTELRKIGALASVFDRPIQCHNAQPTIATAAYSHFWVSEPMCRGPQEYLADEHPLRDRYPILTEPLSIKDGHLTAPERPGLGIDIDRRALEALKA